VTSEDFKRHGDFLPASPRPDASLPMVGASRGREGRGGGGGVTLGSFSLVFFLSPFGICWSNNVSFRG